MIYKSNSIRQNEIHELAQQLRNEGFNYNDECIQKLQIEWDQLGAGIIKNSDKIEVASND